MFTVNFLRDLTERAIKTLSQSLLATLALGTGLFAVSWQHSLIIAGTATVASVLSSIVSAPFGTPGTASVANIAQVAPQVTAQHVMTEQPVVPPQHGEG